MIDFPGNSAANGDGNGFTLAYFGTAATTFESLFTGVLVAPSAQITLGAGTALTFTGQFYVSSLVVTPRAAVICRGDMLP